MASRSRGNTIDNDEGRDPDAVLCKLAEEQGYIEEPTTRTKVTSLELYDKEAYTKFYADNFFRERHHNYVGGNMDDPVIISIENWRAKAPKPDAPAKTAEDDAAPKSDTLKVLVRNKDGNIFSTIPRKAVEESDSGVKVFQEHFPQYEKTKFTKVYKMKDLLLRYEAQFISFNYKFGVLYCKEGQNDERDMYNNEGGSEAYDEFLTFIGDKINLQGHQGYNGGLDVNSNATGKHSIYTTHQGCQIMFHVATMLPFDVMDPQKIEKKRHLGNDVVIIIFRDAGKQHMHVDPTLFKSQFNHIWFVVTARKGSTGTFYKISVIRKDDVPTFGPIITGAGTFTKGEEARQWMLTKLINSERAAMFAPSFKGKLSYARKTQLGLIIQKGFEDLLKANPPGTPGTPAASPALGSAKPSSGAPITRSTTTPSISSPTQFRRADSSGLVVPARKPASKRNTVRVNKADKVSKEVDESDPTAPIDIDRVQQNAYLFILETVKDELVRTKDEVDELKKENRSLRSEVTSLRDELKKYEELAKQNTSLAAELKKMAEAKEEAERQAKAAAEALKVPNGTSQDEAELKTPDQGGDIIDFPSLDGLEGHEKRHTIIFYKQLGEGFSEMSMVGRVQSNRDYFETLAENEAAGVTSPRGTVSNDPRSLAAAASAAGSASNVSSQKEVQPPQQPAQPVAAASAVPSHVQSQLSSSGPIEPRQRTAKPFPRAGLVSSRSDTNVVATLTEKAPSSTETATIVSPKGTSNAGADSRKNTATTMRPTQSTIQSSKEDSSKAQTPRSSKPTQSTTSSTISKSQPQPQQQPAQSAAATSSRPRDIEVVILPDKITYAGVEEKAGQLRQTIDEAKAETRPQRVVKIVQKLYDQTLTLFNLLLHSGREMGVEAGYLKETLTELVMNAKLWLKSPESKTERDAFMTSCAYLIQAVDVALVSCSLWK